MCTLLYCFIFVHCLFWFCVVRKVLQCVWELPACYSSPIGRNTLECFIYSSVFQNYKTVSIKLCWMAALPGQIWQWANIVSIPTRQCLPAMWSQQTWPAAARAEGVKNDKTTTEQAFLTCTVCECDMKSMVTLSGLTARGLSISGRPDRRRSGEWTWTLEEGGEGAGGQNWTWI